MGLDIGYTAGQTPLDEDEKEGLLIPTITTRGELDEFEQQNIEQAVLWTLNRSFKVTSVFTAEFIRTLHRRMYGRVWSWAGEFRTSNKNIGVDRWHVAAGLKALLDDARFWHINSTYGPDELTMRFKHRLVSIHCFPDGNGRHSRLLADIMIKKVFGLPVYTWGAADPAKRDDQRSAYLAALKAADRGDIQPLIGFARS